jgi:hypothetical protein
LNSAAVSVSVMPYAIAAARAPSPRMFSATSRVGKGMNATTIRKPDGDHQEGAVRVIDLFHHGVVVHPDDPDRQEADDVGDVGRPGALELMRERRTRRRARSEMAVDAQDQERRRDGEHAVREGLEPPRVHPGWLWSAGSSTITGIVREVFVGYSANAGHRSA